MTTMAAAVSCAIRATEALQVVRLQTERSLVQAINRSVSLCIQRIYSDARTLQPLKFN